MRSQAEDNDNVKELLFACSFKDDKSLLCDLQGVLSVNNVPYRRETMHGLGQTQGPPFPYVLVYEGYTYCIVNCIAPVDRW